MNLKALATTPPGVEAAARLIAGLDECLALGFARLGPAQHEALDAVVATFAGTPLERPLHEATAAIRRSEFLVKHFCALAAGRAALQGAQYDALFQQASAAIGRNVTEPDLPKALSAEGHHTAWLASSQQWLMELALAGFAKLEPDSITPFTATLEQMQAEPKLVRPAALLTGFFIELLQRNNGVPVMRWADLWTRGMLLAQQPPASENGPNISGTFYPLGVDLRSHAHFANAVVYGLFDAGKKTQLVRLPLSSYKVDVLTAHEVWHLFRPGADPLLEALAAKKSLELSNVPLLPTGDLRWTGKAKLGSAFDPLAVGAKALTTAPLPPVAPLARHPVQLAELVYFENCSVRDSKVSVGDAVLPIATNRLPHGCEIDAAALDQASAMNGLLRFDAGAWAVQPLTVRTGAGKKQRTVMTGESALELCKKDKLKTLATLSERASKLLRKS
jgi:hypothetical protein